MNDPRQCERVARSGHRCNGKKVVGSSFCLVHQPRQVWLPVVMSFLLGAGASWCCSWYFYQRSVADEMDRARDAEKTVSRTCPRLNRFPTIVLGDGMIVYQRGPGRLVQAFNGCPFQVSITPYGLVSLWGEIRDTNGVVVAVASGDVVSVVNSARYDVNSDLKGIEILDSNQRSVFLLIVEQLDKDAKDRFAVAADAEYTRRMASLAERKRRSASKPPIGNLWEHQFAEEEAELTRQHEDTKAFIATVEEVVHLYYVSLDRARATVSTPAGLISRAAGEQAIETERAKIPRVFAFPSANRRGQRLRNS